MTDTFTTGRQEVEPQDIRTALRGVWTECCAGDDERAGARSSDITRALTHNIVAVADKDQVEAMNATLAALVTRQPCRAFVAVLDERAKVVEAAVHGVARRHGDARHLLLEQIDLRVAPTDADALAGVVRPLLVNDIPAHLFWSAAWPDDERRFDALARLVDHAIVDSSRSPAPGVVLDALARRRDAGLCVTDLAWLRVRPWRRALAEAFERCRYDRAAGTTVVIRHGEAAFAAALLLGRWLEERLAAAVELEIDAASTCQTPAAVELHNGHSQIAATRRDRDRIEVEVETQEMCFLPFSVPDSRGRDVDLLAAAIDMC